MDDFKVDMIWMKTDTACEEGNWLYSQCECHVSIINQLLLHIAT